MFQKLASHFKNNIGEYKEVALLVPTVSLYALINKYFVCAYETEGPSMLPTLDENSVVLTDKRSSTLDNLKVGDIVVSYPPWS